MINKYICHVSKHIQYYYNVFSFQIPGRMRHFLFLMWGCSVEERKALLDDHLTSAFRQLSAVP